MQVFVRNGFTIMHFCKGSSPFGTAVCDQNCADTPFDKTFQCQLTHFTRPDHQHRFPGEFHKNRRRKIDGDGTDRHLARTDLGLGTNRFCDGKGFLKKLMDNAIGRLFGLRNKIGIMDLTQNLGFPHDEAVQAGSHPKQVTDDLFTFIFIKIIGKILFSDVMPVT